MFEHFRGNEAFVKRILDLMDQCNRQNRWIITPFLTPLEQDIATKVMGKQCIWKMDGGFVDAEMKRLAMGPYDYDVDFEMCCLKATYLQKERCITHRDVLGALMHLGLARNQFGDIVIVGTNIYVFVRKEIVPILTQECKQIARYSIHFEESDEIIQHQEELHYENKTIHSLRLDCVVAACTNLSRTKAERLIQSKLVKVNHLPLEDCTCLCNNNSTVSIRGYGRFHLKTDGRVSKKGRIIIEIGKYKG